MTTSEETRAHGGLRRRAVVVGGGLAGTAAALSLADAGTETVLVESRPRLGGLAFSFRRDSPAGELTVDNGQHVHLRCCTAYLWFLRRIGGEDLAPLQPRLDVPVLDVGDGNPRLGRIRRTGLPVPLHLAGSLAAYPHLTPAERLGAARAALALGRLDPADPRLDETDFGSWLHAHGQSPRAVEALWDLIGLPTLNARAPQASLALAAKVFRTGLLSSPGAADVGVSRVPLGRLHDSLARTALEKAGVETRTRCRVRALERDEDGGWHVVTADGETLRASSVVVAVPPEQAASLLPEGALADPEGPARLGSSPILNLHVLYDRRVLRRPFFAALGSPVQWVFDRTRQSGMQGPGQYLAVSQSAADKDIDRPVSELRERYLPELARLLPAASGAGVRDFFVTRERSATFDPRPGNGRNRPGTRTGVPGVHLAGAWTDTGWPATMEGAVRSGVLAARAALGTSRGPRAQRSPSGHGTSVPVRATGPSGTAGNASSDDSEETP